MNTVMFIVGFTIFCLYIGGLLFMLNKSHKDQAIDILKDPEIPDEFKESL